MHCRCSMRSRVPWYGCPEMCSTQMEMRSICCLACRHGGRHAVHFLPSVYLPEGAAPALPALPVHAILTNPFSAGSQGALRGAVGGALYLYPWLLRQR
jgi:hypothetical protein